MKQKTLILSLFILSIVMNSCMFSLSIKGNGNVVEETRQLNDFDEVKVTRGMNAFISIGDDFKVVVKADENLLEYIETELEGDMLIVRSTANIRNAKSKAVYITLPEIESLKSTAGSNIYSENVLEVGDIELSASAGANLKLRLNADAVNASASAGSNIFLEGKANSLNATASSGSNIKAGDLNCKQGELKVSSGANVWAATSKSLTAKASSGGNIFYAGEPSETDISKSSGGNVIKN
ncbi:head GIN domain-containing protein [Maribellus sp. YY47]|uniref:head GIN domain-containing protein n=1 Tax=Maribellus sp. YY47 TaxID=2929486 RepID=UPI002001D209|nr:head GIN domain-containing protein [Maribellus sp. YY47]MCK3683762.1 DUF2807 domain-containing protein [Maribellus sp. YY47]